MTTKPAKSTKNIYQRILAVMAEIDYVKKDGKTPQYPYVSHDKVTALMHKAFVKHGIVCIPHVKSSVQNTNRTEVLLQVDFINPDDPSDSIFTTALGYGIDNGDKGPGKAISYAFKYALLKTFCLETGDDTDSDDKAVHQPAKALKQQKPIQVKKNGCITRDQLILMTNELTSVPNVADDILNGYKIDMLSELPEKEFVNVMTRIKEIIRTMEK